MSREFGIGPVPEGIDEPLRDFLTQARNMLLAGNRTGAFTGRFKGSLAGVAAGGSTTIVVPGGPGGGGYVYDPTPPPTPTGVSVGAGIDFVGVTTDPPTFTQGNGYGRTIVYGAKYDPVAGGPLPTFSNATIVHEFVGQVGTFPTEPATQWHIWVKWRTRDGIDSVSPQGGTNGTQVTTGQDVTKLLEALTGEITQSQLFSTLNSKIDLIDGPSSTAGTVNARVLAEATARAAAILAESTARASDIGTLNAAIDAEESARISADSAEAISRSTLAAQLRGAYTGTDPAALTTGLVFNERQARVSAEGAIASSVTALSATVSSNTAAITAEQTARANADSALASQIAAVSASAGNKTYRQTAAPTSGMLAGDLWFDSDDNNKSYRYNGSAWVLTDDTRIASNAAAISSEITARADADTALSTQINTVSAVASGRNRTYSQPAAPTTGMVAGDVWFDSDDSNKAYRYNGTAWVATDDARIAANVAAIASEVTARANADTALASSITTLTSTVNGNSAAISTEATTRANADGHLGAQYTVRAQVSANGSTVVGGFGLSGTSGGTSGPTIDFGIVANRFYIAPPTGTANVPSILPFIVQATPTTLNGAPIPAGVYIDSAYIRDLTAVVARMGNAWITNAMIASLAANKITAGSIAVGQFIQSSDYVSGTSGWRIGGNMAEFGFASIRGTLQAAQVAAGFVTASMMQAGIMSADNVLTRGLTVRNSAGQVILDSGGLRNATYGTNLLYNGDFASDLDQWQAESTGIYVESGRGYNLANVFNILPADARGNRALWSEQGAPVAGGENEFIEFRAPPLVVQQNDRVIASAYVAARRCVVRLFLFGYNSAGTLVFYFTPSGTTHQCASEEVLGGSTLDQWKRIYEPVTIGANIAFVRCVIRKYNTIVGETSSYLFATRLMMEKAAPLASVPAPWAPPSDMARITANNASTFIDDLAVNTLQLADNAVTISVGSILASNQTTPSIGFWSVLTAPTFDPQGGKLRILASLNGEFTGAVRLILRINGADVAVVGGQEGPVPVSLSNTYFGQRIISFLSPTGLSGNQTVTVVAQVFDLSGVGSPSGNATFYGGANGLTNIVVESIKK